MSRTPKLLGDSELLQNKKSYIELEKNNQNKRRWMYLGAGSVSLTVVIFIIIAVVYRNEDSYLSDVILPKGFTISLFGTFPFIPRSIVSTKAGNVFIGSEDNVYWIVAKNNKANDFIGISNSIPCPCSVALFEDTLFISGQGSLWRIQNVDDNAVNGTFQLELLCDSIPFISNRTGDNKWYYITVNKNGVVFMNLGVSYDDSVSGWWDKLNSSFGKILSFQPPFYNKPDDFAIGIKSSGGIASDPVTSKLLPI
eukprot:TRINITY_DN4220_c0_g1_i3.p1 TRINITY_DN4220_c0_g1~~TRINITY_DN4220_c0_g1_i3.p1  ORF type:complete len:253 (-),score=37.94 TRINITY_DN4220_c0_g1_i3:41-799(-)